MRRILAYCMIYAMRSSNIPLQLQLWCLSRTQCRRRNFLIYEIIVFSELQTILFGSTFQHAAIADDLRRGLFAMRRHKMGSRNTFDRLHLLNKLDTDLTPFNL